MGWEKLTAEVTDNDNLRLFGILMSIQRNKYILSRLSEGTKERDQLDEFVYSPEEVFQSLELEFNNDKFKVVLPTDSEE